jgi:predicted dehydrogenase
MKTNFSSSTREDSRENRWLAGGFSKSPQPTTAAFREGLASASGSHSRRRFLAAGAFGAVGIGLMPASFSTRLTAAPASGRRIGFVDDHLNNYHANVFLQALRGPLRERGFTLAGCTGLKQLEGRAWAEQNQVPYFAEAAALSAAVDFFMVLAPSTPETHLDLCRAVLPLRKPTYVDKTFAPDLATAIEIFALADQHGTPLQTTSALRYTNVQAEAKGFAPARVEHMITWGGGGSFDEYAIHPLELLISVMGPEAVRLMRRGSGPRAQLLIDFTGERSGVVNVYPQSNTPFAASLTTEKQTKYFEVDVSKIFVNNLAAILDFFLAGQPNIDRRETLTLMRILDAAKDPAALKAFVPLT